MHTVGCYFLSTSKLVLKYSFVTTQSTSIIMAESVQGEYFKPQDKAKIQHYEVLIPGDFTSRHPWGSFPDEEWEGMGIEYPFSLVEPEGTSVIPIHRLVHVTHNMEAESISSLRGYYTFQPKPKLGKGYGKREGLLTRETYVRKDDKKYHNVPQSEDNPIFPGYLSWWGIDTTETYKFSQGMRRLLHKIKKEGHKGNYVPGYLKEKPQSHYGNNSFSISLNDILEAYQRARIDKAGSKIQLKVGGTLRYAKEICYVVIIGMEGDKELESMPVVGDYQYCRPFRHNGLVDTNGCVIDSHKIPDFKAFFIISSIKESQDRNGKNNYIQFSWEQLTFAMYFPDPTQRLECMQESITTRKVEHMPLMCMHKQLDPTSPHTKRKCPNDITRVYNL